jgi:hypothetical protein
MECPEREALLADYRNASERYGIITKRLDRLGNVAASESALQEASDAATLAWLAYERAKDALRIHEHAHGCSVTRAVSA